MLLACSKKMLLCWVTPEPLHLPCATAVGSVPWNSGSFTEGAAPCCARSTCLGKQAFRVYFPVTLQVLLPPPNAGAGRGSPGLCWRHQGEPLCRRQLFPGMFFTPMQGKNICRERLLCRQHPWLCTVVRQAREWEQLLLGKLRGNTARGSFFVSLSPLLWDLIPTPDVSQNH